VSPRTTEENWQKTHETILVAAEQLFAKKGYNGTSMNDIVNESGLSKGAIYGHFENKERLFLSLWERQTVIGIEQMRQIFTAEDGVLDKLQKVANVTIAGSIDCPRELGKMLLEFMVSASRMSRLEPDLQKRYETIHGFIAEIIEEGIKKGELKEDLDSKTVTSILFATLDGLSLHYATLGIEFDSMKIRESLLNMVFEGIKA
jgi:TetR/AcrR family transcriptional regulator, transcriptional repressor for nem operon